MVYKLIVLFFKALLCFLLLILGNTVYFRLIRVPEIAKQPFLPLKEASWLPLTDDMVSRLQFAVRFETISYSSTHIDRLALANFSNFLLKEFPLTHSTQFIRAEFVANNSLLYTVTGTDAELVPFLLTAHLDVVPTDNQNWTKPPFQGDVVDGYMYGRGTIDNKQSVMGILEALESLLRDGFRPRRSFYVAFGHDEEVGGVGATTIVSLLQSRGLRKLEFILDEGNMVIGGQIPNYNLALIGVTERSHLVLKYSVQHTSGHASMPGSESSIGILSNAMAKLERHKFHGWCGYGSEVAALEAISPYVDFWKQAVIANFRFIAPILNKFVTMVPIVNGVCRTTRALTVFQAGSKENVLAEQAMAIIDHRLHPLDSLESVIEIDRAVIDDDRVKIETVYSGVANIPLADYGPQAFGYQVIRAVANRVFKNAVVVPLILPAVTDSRHYLSLTHNIYRFSGTYCETIRDATRAHGADERLQIVNYGEIINMHRLIIVNAQQTLEDAAPESTFHANEF